MRSYCLRGQGLLDVRDKNIKDGIAAADDETGLEEAACSMIYAAPRLPRDVRELGTVRAMLVERFGKDFAVKANENEGGVVPARVSDKLRVDPPKKGIGASIPGGDCEGIWC